MAKNLVLQIALGVFLGALGALSVMELWHSYREQQLAETPAVTSEPADSAARDPGADKAKAPETESGIAAGRSVTPPALQGQDMEDSADAEQDEDVEEMEDVDDESDSAPQ